MKGFVPTPPKLVDVMVEKLFAGRSPSPRSRVLDPGCGTGAFIDGIVRWCERKRVAVPVITGVEENPTHLLEAAKLADKHASVELENRDFLAGGEGSYDYIIGNPPYVSIERLSQREKQRYRSAYGTAVGRFDLYLLFFEQALSQLRPGGRLVFVTPEKYLYVRSAAPLRRLLAERLVEEITLVDEAAFGNLVTYPTITTVANRKGNKSTHVVLRDLTEREVPLPLDGDSWLPVLRGREIPAEQGAMLADVCFRISCGVATGADAVFVRPGDELSEGLRAFAHPTIAGRQLGGHSELPPTTDAMLIPYARSGRLLEFDALGELASHLSSPTVEARLRKRTCVQRKPWYAFHETPPLADLLRPKILCKDISPEPKFWVDKKGTIVPRHSVYYIVPRFPEQLEAIAAYLNSSDARSWFEDHCHRAANGFLRLQSTVLKKLPIPDRLLDSRKATHAA